MRQNDARSRVTATGRPAGDSRCSSTGHPAVADAGRLQPAERLLDLHREHRRRRVAVVDPDPRPARHRQPLGRELVQALRRRPRQHRAAGVRSGSRSARSSVAAPSDRCARARRRRSRPATARRAPGGRRPAAGAAASRRRPASSSPCFGAGPRAAPADELARRVRSAPAAAARSRPAATRRAPTSPSASHLVHCGQQRRAGLPGGGLVDRGGQPDPRGGAARLPVGDRDRQPRRARSAPNPAPASAAVPPAMR